MKRKKEFKKKNITNSEIYFYFYVSADNMNTRDFVFFSHKLIFMC